METQVGDLASAPGVFFQQFRSPFAARQQTSDLPSPVISLSHMLVDCPMGIEVDLGIAGFSKPSHQGINSVNGIVNKYLQIGRRFVSRILELLLPASMDP